MALAAVVQTIVISRAALPALDCLRSVAAAQALTQTPRWETLVNEPESPVFPVIVGVLHHLRCECARAMQSPWPLWGTSAQLAAALPLVILPIPVWLFARRVVGERAALVAAAIVCITPPIAQLGAEGIGDSWHLLFLASSIACLVHNRRHVRFGICSGIFLGAAMLVRAEAALLAIAFTITTMLGHLGQVHLMRVVRSEKLRSALNDFSSRSDAPDGQRLICFVIGLALPMFTWLTVTGDLTPRAAMNRLLARAPARDGWMFNSEARKFPQFSTRLEGESFDSKEPGSTTRRHGFSRAAVETVDELFLATAYMLIPLALLGWRLRENDDPWETLALTASLLWLLAGFANALVTGYLSSRHLLPVVLFLAPRAGQGFLTLLTAQDPSGVPRTAVRVAAVVILLGGGVWLARPLHQDRAGHRLAAEWIATQGESGIVLDSWGWTALYHGSPTYRYDAAREAFADPRLAYVVVEARELTSGSPRAETLQRLLAENGSQVAEFTPVGSQSPVLLFHWRPRLAQNAPPTSR